MLELLQAGRKAEFDGFMLKTLDPVNKSYLDFRMRPFGFASYYDTFKAVMTYNLSDVAGKIRCPLLITEPANESYWPGQSRQLYDLVSSPKKTGALLGKRRSRSSLRTEGYRIARPPSLRLAR